MAFQGDSSSSSSYSSSFVPRWAYDVFLSFRDEDTCNTFIAHLYDALHRKGINTYIDDKPRRGDEISPALLAIEGSRISVIVLSENYASSTWCLDELIKILECKETNKQLVLPVFYKVDPSEVRHLRERVGEALAKLEDWVKDDTKVHRWKKALQKVANLSGWHLRIGDESKFIHQIVQVVSRYVHRTYLNVAKYPVGIESRVHDINALLSIGMDDIRMVGIFGVGGIGKTTIAKMIYNLIAYLFEDSCFLANVRETSMREYGLVQLQKTVLSQIHGNSSLKVGNVDRGINVMKKRCCCKRILLVLDDVDQLVQLEALCGGYDWFGLGSRIIITTRDKHLLTTHKVDLTYKVKELDHNEALKLFSQNAFKNDEPNDDFVELTEHAIRYAAGLPLALIVLGSDLYGRDVHYWKSALKKYKRIPEKSIQEKLKISYDGLEESEKDIFLDIACFFKGDDVEYVIKILDSCGFFPNIGIIVLMDKSLITIDESNQFMMHDLLQEMGREIVRQESSKDPGKRSRLWFHEDVRHVLEENTGTYKIEGILIDLPEQDLIHLSSKAFMKMKRLRLFVSRNAHFSRGTNFLSNELRLIDWPKYPEESLPPSFHGKKLVVLRMPNSRLLELENIENYRNLTIMDFTDCIFLRKIPNVSRIPNLEKLILNGCTDLVEVHFSVGFLDKLCRLSLEGCSNLRNFPRRFKLKSLEFLDLSLCSRLKNFPEIECQMECLKNINFQGTGIEEVPSSIGYIIGLKGLNIDGCLNLMNLPSSILQLQHLGYLSLRCCSKCVMFPEVEENRQSMPSILSIKESTISSSAELLSLLPPASSSVSNDGCSSMVFPALQHLYLESCVLSESNFFKTFDFSSTLKELDLSWSNIVSLPACIKRFVGLVVLFVRNCKQLQEILQLPPNIEYVYARGCMSMERFLEEPKRSQVLLTTQSMNLGIRVPSELDFFLKLELLDLSCTAISSIPACIKRFVKLRLLILDGCKQLQDIPELPLNIEEMDLARCTSMERFQFNMCDLPRLKRIDLFRCHKLVENIGNNVQIHLLSEGHPKNHQFSCIFSGNKIPDWFRHSKEASNKNSCEIDINEPSHLDWEITRIAFSAITGIKDGHDEVSFEILVDVISHGVKIYHVKKRVRSKFSNHVWLHYYVPESFKLKGNDLQVKFVCQDFEENPSKSVFFKSCGFHLVHRCKEKAKDLMDDIQLTKKRHNDDDDDDDGDGNPQQKRWCS